MVMTNVLIYCDDQTPSWLPSSPKGEIFGNMMQYVVLDGNLLDDLSLVSIRCENDVSTGHFRCGEERKSNQYQRNDKCNISQCIRRFDEDK